MASNSEDLDAFIHAGTRLLGLTMRPEWQEAVRLHLAITLEHARTLGELPLPDETDSALVFSA